MTAPFTCTRCQFRAAGSHDCQDRACHCCYGEPEPDGVIAWLRSPEGEQWSRERSQSGIVWMCPTCRETGVVQVPDKDGCDFSEQPCPEPVHGGVGSGLMP